MRIIANKNGYVHVIELPADAKIVEVTHPQAGADFLTCNLDAPLIEVFDAHYCAHGGYDFKLVNGFYRVVRLLGDVFSVERIRIVLGNGEDLKADAIEYKTAALFLLLSDCC